MTVSASRRRLGLLATTILGMGALPAAAQDPQATARAFAALGSETITVTATRTERSVDEVPATVSVIDDEEIADRLITDIKDLVRFEPGVSVPTAPSRFGAALSGTGRDGNSGFNIRGLEGNRVLIQIDGVRIPDAYAFGPQLVGRGDLVDLDLLKTVEILRGPASALYGSDGVAGAISFATKDPSDYLVDGRSIYGEVHAGYGSADDGWTAGGVGAASAGRWQAMLAYTHREGHETDNKGKNDAPNVTRTEPNPQDTKSDAVLAKLVFAPDDRNSLKLTFDYTDDHSSWDVLSARVVAPVSPTSTVGLAASDHLERTRVSFAHEYEGTGFVTKARTTAYYQDSTTRQFSAEDRFTAADRTRDNTFDNSVWGFATELHSAFDTGTVKHRLVYGGDWSITHQESIRGGTVPTFPDTFPNRAFPTTDYQLLGLFVQDEIAFLGGALTFFPAIRFDWYDLDPETDDPLYAGLPPVGSSDSHWSPKLGVVWKITDEFGAFANLATGFKAPAPSQVNNGFTNLAFGYASISNPDLKPETSTTIEGGLRYSGDRISASITGFYGDYDDFISQEVVGGSFTPNDPALYQYINLQGVEISGIEARVRATLGWGFGAIAAISYAHGTSKIEGVETPLNSVDPVKISAGLSYADPDGRFGGLLAVVHSARKDAADVDGDFCVATCFRPDSFTVFDLTGWVRIAEHARLRAGLFNITDEKYWWWSDVRGLSAASSTLDAYTQPGRNVAVSLSVTF